VEGGQPVFPKPLQARAPSRFSGDSGLLAVKLDGSIGMWDLRTGRETRCLRTAVAPHNIALNPDGRQLAVAYGPRAAVIEIWDTLTGKKQIELPAGKAGYVERPRLASGRPSACDRFRRINRQGRDLGHG